MHARQEQLSVAKFMVHRYVILGHEGFSCISFFNNVAQICCEVQLESFFVEKLLVLQCGPQNYEEFLCIFPHLAL